MQYLWYESLKEYVDSVHEGNKPFQCSTCGASFAKNAKLKVHKASVKKVQIVCIIWISLASVHEQK